MGLATVIDVLRPLFLLIKLHYPWKKLQLVQNIPDTLLGTQGHWEPRAVVSRLPACVGSPPNAKVVQGFAANIQHSHLVAAPLVSHCNQETVSWLGQKRLLSVTLGVASLSPGFGTGCLLS